MNSVLLQEVIRYNKLTSVIVKTIKDVSDAIKGVVAIS